MPKKIWLVIIANASIAKIYELNKKNKTLSLTKTLLCLENRLKEHNLVSDTRGHYQTFHQAKGAYGEDYSFKETNIDTFARNIVSFLETLLYNKENLYEKLLITASPHFLGYLNKRSETLKNKYAVEFIAKDFTTFREKQLIEIIFKA